MAEKKLRRLEIEPADNGGHTITHHFKSQPRKGPNGSVGMDYPDHEQHTFGPEEKQQHAVLSHIAQALGFKKVAAAERKEDEEG